MPKNIPQTKDQDSSITESAGVSGSSAALFKKPSAIEETKPISEVQDLSIINNTELTELLDDFYKNPSKIKEIKQIYEDPAFIVKDVITKEDVPINLLKNYKLDPIGADNVIPVLDEKLMSSFIEKLANKEGLLQFVAEIGDVKVIELLKNLSDRTLLLSMGADANTITSRLANLERMIKNNPIYYHALHESTKNIIDKMQLFIAMHETGHRLGLGNKHHEGFNSSHATQATQDRFNQFVDKTKVGASINVNKIHDSQVTAESICKQLTHHGDLKSISCAWPEHVFSFHFMQDNGKIHIVYVNRGQRHELADLKDPAVSVYTIEDTRNADPLINKLVAVLKTEDRQKISNFISHELQSHISKDEKLKEVLVKSNQKVGNCSIANTNISWHFALASHLMKQQPELNFAEAYKETTDAYKLMRMEDRADAFCSLLKLENAYPSTDYYHNALLQVMEKMYNKDLIDPNRHAIAFLLHKVNEENPEALEDLYHLVMSESFISKDSIKASIKWQWAQEIYQILPVHIQQKFEQIHFTISRSLNPSISFRSHVYDLKRGEALSHNDEAQETLLTNAYQVLGLPSTASDKDIRDRYKELSLKHHPDKNPGHETEHAERFKEIDSAYKLIINSRESNPSLLAQETTNPNFRIR